MPKILAIPGSLRSNSASNQILNAVVSLSQKSLEFEIFDGLGELPHFNDPAETPLTVAAFREKIKHADAVLIVTPEYAFGIPGSLKNALDWTVSSGEFVNKPVGLITASSSGEKGHAALLLVLSAISANVIDKASLLIPFVRTKIDSQGTLKDETLKQKLSEVALNLVESSPRPSA
jgi:chromate reductase, NAD(P)H dehydrogenase (quinone)